MGLRNLLWLFKGNIYNNLLNADCEVTQHFHLVKKPFSVIRGVDQKASCLETNIYKDQVLGKVILKQKEDFSKYHSSSRCSFSKLIRIGQ